MNKPEDNNDQTLKSRKDSDRFTQFGMDMRLLRSSISKSMRF